MTTEQILNELKKTGKKPMEFHERDLRTIGEFQEYIGGVTMDKYIFSVPKLKQWCLKNNVVCHESPDFPGFILQLNQALQ